MFSTVIAHNDKAEVASVLGHEDILYQNVDMRPNALFAGDPIYICYLPFSFSWR